MSKCERRLRHRPGAKRGDVGACGVPHPAHVTRPRQRHTHQEHNSDTEGRTSDTGIRVARLRAINSSLIARMDERREAAHSNKTRDHKERRQEASGVSYERATGMKRAREERGKSVGAEHANRQSLLTHLDNNIRTKDEKAKRRTDEDACEKRVPKKHRGHK